MIRPGTRVDEAIVADHYDDLDRLYREIWGEHVHHGLWTSGRETPEQAVRRLVDRVAHHGGIGANARVCDVGCGYGATARLLSRKYGAEVTGVTLSAAQWRHARGRARRGDRVRILRGNWLANDFPPSSFDAVVAIESTEHMTDKEGCFAEAHRVLRPRGRLVVCAWLAADRPRPRQVRHLLEPICREGRLPGMGSESDYRAWLEKAGFRIECFEDLSAGVRRTWTLCIRRALARVLLDAPTRRYLLSRRRGGGNRVFLLTMFRIRLAYATGAMRYGLFAAVRDGGGAPGRPVSDRGAPPGATLPRPGAGPLAGRGSLR